MTGSPGSRRPPRLMLMTRAPFATAQRIALASASTGIERCGPTTFATRSSRRRREARDPDAVVRLRGDEPGDERAVPLRVDRRRARRRSSSRRRSARAARDASPSTPESITATRTGAKRRRLDPGVERAVLRGVPLARQERVVGHVGDTPDAERPRRTGRLRRRGGRSAPGRRPRAPDRGEVDDTGRRRARGARRRPQLGRRRREPDREARRAAPAGPRARQSAAATRRAAALAVTSAVPPGR